MALHDDIDHTGLTGIPPSIPAGGTTGQRLAKASGTDFDTEWVSAAAETEILNIPTAETNAALVLAPDGVGGVEFRAESGGPGGGSVFPLDDVTLDGTYGDDYLTAPLDAKWTRLSRAVGSETFETPSWMSVLPYSNVNYGDLQAFTTADEFEIRMAASFFSNNTDEGFGPAVLDSANTGLWLGHRASSRLGLFTVTTGTTGTEPVSNLGYAGTTYLGQGRKAWYSIVKKVCNGVDIYWFRVSFDGATWTRLLAGYDPTDFTPAKIGWMVGVQNSAGLERYIGIDWFNATRLSYGNNLFQTPSSGTVTPSSDATSQSGSPSVVINNNFGDEWYFPNTNAAGVHWQVVFSVAQSMNRLIFKARNDPFGVGYVEFSDGSTYGFHQTAAAGWYYLEFPTKSTTLVKIYFAKQGHGANPGWAEIAAYLAS